MVKKNYLGSALSLICISSLLILSVVGLKGAPGNPGFSFLNSARAEMEKVKTGRFQPFINSSSRTFSPPAALKQKISQSTVRFEANRGQYDDRVKFVGKRAGQTIFLTADEAVFVTPIPNKSQISPDSEPKPDGVAGEKKLDELKAKQLSYALRLKFVGANPSSELAGEKPMDGYYNYFRGSDSAKWATDVPLYGAVKYKDFYRGIDLVWYGKETGELEYDYIVAPGANPDQITMEFDGADRLATDAEGNLLIDTPAGVLKHHKPLIYQETDGARQVVSGNYVVNGNRIGFALGEYDRGKSLVIDPVVSAPPLIWSTFLGGSSSEMAYSVKVDAANNVYVAGFTWAVDFPTTTGTQPAGSTEGFVTKLNSAGTSLIYSTFLGGNGGEAANSLAPDGNGNVFVTGNTGSSNFPVSFFCFDRTYNGGGDGFVTKLNSSGGIAYSTYIGGSDDEDSNAIAIDSDGSAYITGKTASSNFPTTSGAYDTTKGYQDDVFVTKLNPLGSSLSYSSFLGGGSGGGPFERGNSIAVDSLGRAYVTGQAHQPYFPVTPGAFRSVHESTQASDLFVAKFNSAGSALVYSAVIGGDGDDIANSIAIDSNGNAYLTGRTDSSDFPKTFGAFDTFYNDSSYAAFVLKLNSGGSSVLYSTFLQGTDSSTIGAAIALDAAGDVYVTGKTASPSFPTTDNAYDRTHNGSFDVFLTKFTASAFAGGLKASTFVGGSYSDEVCSIAINSIGDAYVAGYTQSSNYPTFAGFDMTHNGGTDAFITRYNSYWLP